MKPLNVKIIKISYYNNGFDQPAWTFVEQVIRQHFSNSGLHAMICTGEIIFPPLENQEEMIKEVHKSVAGGHKGIFETYWQL